MNYRAMSIKEGIKYPAFWWYAITELALIFAAMISATKGEFLLAIAIFILLEIREINMKIRDT